MTDINVDSIITMMNSFIPIIIAMALIGAVIGVIGKVNF